MSFNPQHIALDRSNYEEAFLMYIDGELTPAQCAEVEAFAAANPDLAEELELLNATKLPGEAVILENKSDLFAHNIKTTLVDESLLLAIDNELPEEEEHALALRMDKDEDLALQYSLLKKVKLDASETIVYPYKEDLYRRERRTIPAYWMQLAAAIVLLLTIAAFWIISTKNPAPPPVVKAPQMPQLQKSPSQAPETGLAIEQAKKQPASSQPASNEVEKVVREVRKERAPVSNIAANNQKAPAPKTPSYNSLPDSRDRVIASVDLPEYNKPTLEKSGVIDVPLTQQTFNTPRVTTGSTSPYTSIDAPVTDAGVSFAVASDNIDKKGSVRGFLRKATRFIERRTGINPVNEDERLLVGVVAIKL